MRLPLDGFYVSDSDALMNQELVNAYLHKVAQPNGEVIEEGLFGSPGLVSKAVTTSSAIDESNRGTHLFSEQPYFVNGDGLFRLNPDETVTTITGTIPGTGPVSMAASDTELMIVVPGVDGFLTSGSTITTITDSDFKANGLPQTVSYINGKFLVTTDSQKFIVNENNDGSTWNALDFAVDERDPDPLVSGLNHRTQAVLFGTQTTTFYDDIGGTGFPFEANGLVLDKGLFARFSVVEMNDTYFMVGGGVNENAAVWQFSGNGYVKRSTGAIDRLLSKLSGTELDAITSYAYSDNNNYFVEWVLPNETISYDVMFGEWHLKRSTVSDTEASWRPRNVIKAYNNLYCGDRIDGTIGNLSRDFFDEYGETIFRTFDVRPIRSDMNVFAVPRIELTMQQGVGNATTTDPQVSLSKSRNGSTFSDPLPRSVGEVGQYNERPVWKRNGKFDKYALFRFTYAEKAKFVVVRVDATFVGGRV